MLLLQVGSNATFVCQTCHQCGMSSACRAVVVQSMSVASCRHPVQSTCCSAAEQLQAGCGVRGAAGHAVDDGDVRHRRRASDCALPRLGHHCAPASHGIGKAYPCCDETIYVADMPGLSACAQPLQVCISQPKRRVRDPPAAGVLTLQCLPPQDGKPAVLRVYSSSPIGGVYADITADLISQYRQVDPLLDSPCSSALGSVCRSSADAVKGAQRLRMPVLVQLMKGRL